MNSEDNRYYIRESSFSKVKHMVITGTNAKELEKAARSVLQLIKHKYTRRLGNKITEPYLVNMPELAYVKMIWFDLVEDERHIIELSQRIAQFNNEVAIIFTCQKPCIALQKDDRYNIIQLTA